MFKYNHSSCLASDLFWVLTNFCCMNIYCILDVQLPEQRWKFIKEDSLKKKSMQETTLTATLLINQEKKTSLQKKKKCTNGHAFQKEKKPILRSYLYASLLVLTRSKNNTLFYPRFVNVCFSSVIILRLKR